MSRLVGFLGRKTAPETAPVTPLAPPAAPAAMSAPPAPLDLDEDLFSSLAADTPGDGEHDAMRNMLLDASYKLNEMDDIRTSIGRLIEPVGKTLRAYESEKADKIALQSTLDSTRAEYGRLRNEFTDLSRTLSNAQREIIQLRQALTQANHAHNASDTARREREAELAVSRGRAAELERKLAAEVSEARRLRDNATRVNERLAAGDRRIAQLDSELTTVRHARAVVEGERRMLQATLDRTVTEAAKLSRRALEADNAISAATTRLRRLEVQLSDSANETLRLTSALAEAQERRETEAIASKARIDALVARSGESDKLLMEARDQLRAQAEQMRQRDRQHAELERARDDDRTRLDEAESFRLAQEQSLRQLEAERATLTERLDVATRALAARGSALARSDDRIQKLADGFGALQVQVQQDAQKHAREIDGMAAALKRERMERAIAEGALEAGRKDLARLMREVMDLQRKQSAHDAGPRLSAANAA